jgi:hypothetical protein
MTDEKRELEGRAKANHLVASFGKWLGVYDAELDRDNDRSFGEVGFHYDEKADVLEGRVFIEQAYLPSDPDAVKENFRKVAAALNDPAIGGMFERGGGRFDLDEEKRMFFLLKDFPLAELTPRSLRTQMEKLMNIGATWSLHWLGRVARIAHGWEPPPASPVTIGLDGQADQGGGEGGAL